MPERWQFNRAPNWPAHLQAPDLDWRPDPAWGPPPVGWVLWRRRRAPLVLLRRVADRLRRPGRSRPPGC
jgi:hypothetical protein